MGVNTIVMVGVPARMLYYVMLYGAGLLSEIYYSAACENLDVYRSFSGAAARMMAAANAFQAMTQQLDCETGLREMEKSQVLIRMRAIMNRHFERGTLDESELEALVACMFEGMDLADAAEEKFGIDEYV